MSANLPKRGRKMVSVSIYAIAIHSMTAIETPNVLLRVGIATLTMLTSSADIVAPSRTVERMNHFQPGCEEAFVRKLCMLPFMFDSPHVKKKGVQLLLLSHFIISQLQ